MPRTIDEAAVHAALETVCDPELGDVRVTELGIVEHIEVTGGQVRVELVATSMACPATAVIRDTCEEAIRTQLGVDDVEVTFTRRVVWEPDRIDASGREKLRELGIAPPGSGQVLVGIGNVTCPICGGRDTVAESPFGPTPCRSTHFCRSCRNPFEAMKP